MISSSKMAFEFLKPTDHEIDIYKNFDVYQLTFIYNTLSKMVEFNKVCKKIDENDRETKRKLINKIKTFSKCYNIQLKFLCNCEKSCSTRLEKQVNMLDTSCKHYEIYDMEKDDPLVCEVYFKGWNIENYNFNINVFEIMEYKKNLLTTGGFLHSLNDFCYGFLGIRSLECFASNLYFECTKQRNCLSYIQEISKLSCSLKKFRKLKKSLELVFKYDYSINEIKLFLKAKMKNIKEKNISHSGVYMKFDNLTLIKNEFDDDNSEEYIDPISNDDKDLSLPTNDNTSDELKPNISVESNATKFYPNDIYEDYHQSNPEHLDFNTTDYSNVNNLYARNPYMGTNNQSLFLDNHHLKDLLVDFDYYNNNGVSVNHDSIIGLSIFIVSVFLFFKKRSGFIVGLSFLFIAFLLYLL